MRSAKIFEVVGCIAIALMVGRCSPLSPSIQKGDGTLNSAQPGSGVSQPATSGSALQSYSTRVLDAQSYSSALQTAASGQVTVRLSAADQPNSFSDFVNSGTAQITISGVVPTSAQTLLSVDLTVTDIQNDGLSSFQTTLIPTGTGNVWVLSVSPGVSAAVSAEVRDHLSELTLVLNSGPTGTPTLKPAQPTN